MWPSYMAGYTPHHGTVRTTAGPVYTRVYITLFIMWRLRWINMPCVVLSGHTAVVQKPLLGSPLFGIHTHSTQTLMHARAHTHTLCHSMEDQ